MNRDLALATAVSAAKEAGAILRGGRREEKYASTKSYRHDPVTVFDRRSEALIVERIARAFPSHGILGEEGTAKEGASQYRWVIDPLDGTNNFLRGYPQFAVSLALLCGEEPEVACIYDPVREELFTAICKEGALLNGEPLRVSRQSSLDGAFIGVGFSSRPERALRTYVAMEELLPVVRAVRTGGAAVLDLAYVAAGRLDAAWYISLSLWDVAAGLLLIREAGGRASDLAGKPLSNPENGLIISNGRIHGEFLRTVGERKASDPG